jgi:segregation and condensation protein A
MTEGAFSAGEQLSLPFYRVQLEVFEGPLDLLLHLIKKNEVDITDIPVSAITEQYLQYLELLHELQLDVAGEFLVMAATLLLIKSRMLLPSEEEEADEPDPRAELVQQLLDYQRYREAALALAERPLLHRDVFARPPSPPPEAATQRPLRLRVGLWELVAAMKAVLERCPPAPVHEIEPEPVSVRACATTLLERLRTARKLRFQDLFDAGATRAIVIGTFLALLELIRLGAVCAFQEEHQGPIEIEFVHDDVDWLRVEEWERPLIVGGDVAGARDGGGA